MIENLMLNLRQEIYVAATIEATFAAVLEQLGPHNDIPDSNLMPMKLEAWPGGRWYRDLGDGNGHFWGNVQAIKRPTLLEISGPLFMSYPARLERAVQIERGGWRDADQVSSLCAWTDRR